MYSYMDVQIVVSADAFLARYMVSASEYLPMIMAKAMDAIMPAEFC